MPGSRPKSLALVVRNHPFHRRAAREDLDMALAAAALDFHLEVYFLGMALLQLAQTRATEDAHLPLGYRAWSALPDLADIHLFAERQWLKTCERAGIGLILPVRSLAADEMQLAWRRCDHVLAP